MFTIPPPREKVNLSCLYCEYLWLYSDNHWDGSFLIQPNTGVKILFGSKGRTQWRARWYLENMTPNSSCEICVAASATKAS